MEQRDPGETVYRGKVLSVRVEDVPQANGGTQRFEIVERPEAVAIVAVRYEAADGATAEPRVALVRQRRPAIRRETWEIPAGLVEPGERDDAEAAAKRELAEETGLAAESWQRLAREYPTPGYSNESITLYLATGLHEAVGGRAGVPRDPNEIAEVRWVPLSDALARWQRGEIEDGKTILGLHLTQRLIEGQHSAHGANGGETMPLDPMNMPNRPHASYKSIAEREEEDRPGKGPYDPTLKLENILLEEFNYIGVTAYQAMEDRARMFNLYLLLIGVVASALGAIFQIGGGTASYAQPLAIALLLIAGVLGFAFFMKIIRLRQAYRESLLAMNTVKEYYIEKFKAELPDVEKAFRWRLKTVPSGERRGSVTFIISYTIAFLGSLCFAGAAFIAYKPVLHEVLGQFLPGAVDAEAWVLAIAVWLVSLALHIQFYVRTLSKKKERASLAKAELPFDLQ